MPAIVSESVWEAVQARFRDNKRLMGGNPRTARMLAGRVFCPVCGNGLICKRSNDHLKQQAERHPEKKITQEEILKKKAVRHYACGKYLRKLVNTGDRGCIPAHYLVADVEKDVITVLEHAAQNPDAVREVLAGYEEELPEESADAQAQELARLEGAMKELDARQAATVKAQIAGIMAELPADAYNDVFAEIADSRTELTAKRDALAKTIKRETVKRRHQSSSQHRNDSPENVASENGFQGNDPQRRGASAKGNLEDESSLILSNIYLSLTSPDVPGEDKRDLVGTVIEKVIPSKEGTYVVFLPHAFCDPTLQPYVAIYKKARA